MYRYSILFFITLLIGYGSDLSPYYVALFSGNQMKVIGSLLPFEGPCHDSPQGEIVCATSYRIPQKYIQGRSLQDHLGLGIIIHSIEVSCEGQSQPPIILGKVSDGGRMKSYYDTYHTLPLSDIPCQSDILIKNWFNPKYKRHGFANGPATVGEPSWIARTKELVEFFHREFHIVLAAVFLMFYVGARSLKRITYIDMATIPFEPWSLYWLFYISILSDTVIDAILPLSFRFWMWFVPRICYFFGMTLITGSLFTFFLASTTAPRWMKAVSSWITHPRKPFLGLPLLVLITALINLSPLYSIGYRFTLGLIGTLAILFSIPERSTMMFYFGICVLSDCLKTLMFPYLPAPRMIVVYTGLLLIDSIFQRVKTLENAAKMEGKSDLALQIAHDIRSPLNALNIMLPALAEIPEQKRMIVKSAIDRIQEIARDLLVNYKKENSSSHSPRPHLITLVLGQIIHEKRLQLRAASEIKIEYTSDHNLLQVFCPINAGQFVRIISNLINNSIESFKNQSGRIEISIQTSSMSVSITLSDNGSGIPPHVMKKLGAKGVTFGKEGTSDGSGLGIYHAKQTLESWGGRLHIASKLGQGTTINLQIPRVEPPVWSLAALRIPSRSSLVVVLDDDSLIHALWSQRLLQAGIQANQIYHLRSPDELKSLHLPSAVYLIDYHFAGSKVNGLDVIESLGISSTDSCILVTHSYDDPEVRERCEKLNLKIIPKVLADQIPIQITG